MIVYQCDACGARIPRDGLRYTVNIDVRAAYDQQEIGLAELVRDHRRELLSLIDSLRGQPESEIEESVYKAIKLDLCPSCQRMYIRDPLQFRSEPGASPSFDVDEFLRSLGYGPSEDD